MGIRGIDELLAVLPPAAADSARAVAQGLAELSAVRYAALGPDDVRALGELWERFTAQAASGRLGVLAAIDARDDVVPKARVGDAGAVFANHALGQRRGTAHRDGRWAGLLRAEVGDLPAVGAALAAGDISTAHVEVAVRAQRDLGTEAREALVECQAPLLDGLRSDGQDAASVAQLHAALDGLSTAFTARVRQILVVDVLLAHFARRHSVAELEVIARRIVDTLNRADPKGAHERRFLHMSPLPDGSWRARFECGAEQGLIIKRAIAAGSAPRPGKAIDQDGVQHEIPDVRDPGARQIDALTDMAALFLTGNGIPLPHAPASNPASGSTRSGRADAGDDPDADDDASHGGNNPDGVVARHNDDDDGDADDSLVHDAEGCEDASDEGRDDEADQPGEDPEEAPPPGEGQTVVLREPGVLYGPYPRAEMVVVAGIEHVATAWAHRPQGLPLNLHDDFKDWVRRRFGPRLRTREHSLDESPPDESPSESPGEGPPDEPQDESPVPDESSMSETRSGGPSPNESPPDRTTARQGHDQTSGACACQRDGRDLAWLGRALSPYGVPARVEQAGPVPAETLQLLACSATIRAALLAPNGALLDLGRSQRLASAAQKTALLARDGGCVVPGCVVPGDACDAHHVIWWENLGPTDLDNLALVCGRHHAEVHQGTWEIQMRDGIPWVRPPSWIDRTRPLLRNAAHHPYHNRTDDGCT